MSATALPSLLHRPASWPPLSCSISDVHPTLCASGEPPVLRIPTRLGAPPKVGECSRVFMWITRDTGGEEPSSSDSGRSSRGAAGFSCFVSCALTTERSRLYERVRLPCGGAGGGGGGAIAMGAGPSLSLLAALLALGSSTRAVLESSLPSDGPLREEALESGEPSSYNGRGGIGGGGGALVAMGAAAAMSGRCWSVGVVSPP